MVQNSDPDPRDARARLRFQIVAHLLASPPKHGELGPSLEKLAAMPWLDPVSGKVHYFHKRTIELWFYTARNAGIDPVSSLRRQRRKDANRHPRLSVIVIDKLLAIRASHPEWTLQLVRDELAAALELDGHGNLMPSYSTIRRFLKRTGQHRRRPAERRSSAPSDSKNVFQIRETRRFEVDRLHALWHLDFHHGSRQVLDKSGRWRKPYLLAVLDDYSRLICHAQWYLNENTEDLVHAFIQALQRRGMPRALLSDNGAAMTSEEFTTGLIRLGIQHETTLPYHPQQNGKQERFFRTFEGRLMAMLGDKPDLDLEFLNLATHAWIDREYHRTVHREIQMSPIDRFEKAVDASRPTPSMEVLTQAFAREVTRKIRRQTATVTIDGIRFEVPFALRHIEQLRLRYASWDKRRVWIVDTNTGKITSQLWPEDLVANSEEPRRVVEEFPASPNGQGLAANRQSSDGEPVSKKDELPAILRQYLAELSSTGLPPSYVPKIIQNNESSQGGHS